jgi:hypothetical protein
MGDYRIGLIRHPTLSLAKVVTASSAFPPFLSPVVIDNPGQFEAVEGADLNGKPEYTQHLYLSDGGVYDNLGLETVWNRYQTVLVSDAGAPFSIGDKVETDWVKQTLRALDVATDQSRALRKRALIDDFKRNVRSGTYWGIDTRIANYQLPTAMACADQIVRPLAKIRTRLNPFDDVEQEHLINWGYALCDAAVRTHAPQIVNIQAQPQWPCPNTPWDSAMHGHLFISVAIALILAILSGSVADAAQKRKKAFAPGKARWEIKTSLPANTNLSNSKKVNLQTLLAIKQPPGAKGHSRRMDHKRYQAAPNAAGLVEGQVISATGWVHLIAAEPDGDYHIQIAQTRNSQALCFIVEVPRPLQTHLRQCGLLNS